MLTQEQENEIKRLKSYYPYRVIWCMFDKNTNKFEAYASKDKRQPNKQTQIGHKVFIIK